MTSRKKGIDPFTPDKDNPEWKKEDFKNARPAGEVLEKLGITPPRPVGRPPIDNPKISVTLRLDEEIVKHFKKDGRGWQTRLNAALRHEIGTSERTKTPDEVHKRA